MIEVNPRASRTVPFASKATGVNLVDAAARLAAGARLPELELPEERRPEQVSVKAAVLPFARFPGADPVLGPEMRSTGEVMASAADFRRRSRRPSAPPAAAADGGTAFLSVRDARQAAVRRRQALAALGFELLATAGTASTLAAAGLAGERRSRRATPVVDLIRARPLRPRRQHAAGLRRADATASRSARRRSSRASRASRRSPARRPPWTRSRTRAPRRALSLQERIEGEAERVVAVVADRARRPVHAAPRRARRARSGHPRPVLHARGAGPAAAAADERLPRAARRARRS